jgi:hypothetical protein
VFLSFTCLLLISWEDIPPHVLISRVQLWFEWADPGFGFRQKHRLSSLRFCDFLESLQSHLEIEPWPLPHSFLFIIRPYCHSKVLHGPHNLLAELPNTVHSCSRHGLVAVRLTSEGPGRAIHLKKHLPCLESLLQSLWTVLETEYDDSRAVVAPLAMLFIHFRAKSYVPHASLTMCQYFKYVPYASPIVCATCPTDIMCHMPHWPYVPRASLTTCATCHIDHMCHVPHWPYVPHASLTMCRMPHYVSHASLCATCITDHKCHMPCWPCASASLTISAKCLIDHKWHMPHWICATCLTDHKCHMPHWPYVPHVSLTMCTTCLTDHMCHMPHWP